MDDFTVSFSTVTEAPEVPPEAVKAQEVWEETNHIPLEYLRLVVGDLSQTVSPVKVGEEELERERFRVLTRESRLKMDCPFPPEPDLA